MEKHVMAREYNPAPKPKPVRLRVYYDKRTISGKQVKVWHAKCIEHGISTTGDTQQEAVRDFQSHLSAHHRGQIVRKVE
jgi:hypothetical protein